MKKKLIMSGIAIVAIVTLMVGKNCFVENSNDGQDLLMQNVEALSSDGEGGAGMTTLRICSRQAGKVFCTAIRGKRKWAIDVKIGAQYAGSVICPDCPDQDFDYAD